LESEFFSDLSPELQAVLVINTTKARKRIEDFIFGSDGVNAIYLLRFIPRIPIRPTGKVCRRSKEPELPTLLG
jgi:hypothetical protein